MFNLSGSEIVFILLAGLVVLGPEKLPNAIRQVGRIYSELRRMGQGFQDELRATLDEPVRELRETADLARSTLTRPLGEDGPDLTAVTPRSISASVQRVLDSATASSTTPAAAPAEPLADTAADAPVETPADTGIDASVDRRDSDSGSDEPGIGDAGTAADEDPTER